jgi:hypothetical protein
MNEFIKKHKLLSNIVILVLICILMLIALEIRQPYFFLQDDNADSYICQYVHSLRSVRARSRFITSISWEEFRSSTEDRQVNLISSFM